MSTRTSLVLGAILVILPGCAEHPPRLSTAGPQKTQSRNAGLSANAQSGRFDALSFTLRLRSDRVPSGGTLLSRLVVANRSGRTVVDPACALGETRSGLVPVDQPDAEPWLWMHPVVDCGGPFAMKSGFRDAWQGPDFPARTQFGDPLPPGDYAAVLEIVGLSSPLTYAVTVE
jgi:hypothetical protein